MDDFIGTGANGTPKGRPAHGAATAFEFMSNNNFPGDARGASIFAG